MAHGKSTLSKLIAGLLKPKSGRITVDNINTANKKEFYNLRKKIGMVFQNPENQIIFNNVYDDIAFALKNLELDNEEIRIKTSLEKLRMDKYLKSPTYELSLGQKQRVTIAGVLAVNPKYIIFGQFAITESRYTWDDGDLTGMPKKTGIYNNLCNKCNGWNSNCR